MELPNKNPFRDDMNAPLIDAIKDIMEGKINEENLNIGTHRFRTIAAAKKNAGVKEEAQVESYGNPFTPRVPGTFAAPNFRGGLKAGDKVRVPHKGKMVSGKIVRYDDGGTDKARQHGGGYIVDIGEPASILVPKQNVRKEEVGIEEVYDGAKSRAAMQSNIKKAPTPKDKEELVKLDNAIKKSPKVYGISMDALGDLAPDETPSRKKLTPMAARAADGYDAKNTDRSVSLGIISKINKRIKEEVGIEEAVDAKQAEIDAKIRKVNAADAVAKIKEIVNSYDKQTKRMIIAGMKSIKESVKDAYAEVTEDEIISEDEWGGGFETSREAQAGVQAAMKADAKKRQMLIISALQQVIDGKMSKAAFKKLTGHSYDEMMTLPFYSKKVKMKKEEVENLDESATKAAIEDFMYDTLTKAAIAELKPIVKSKTSDRMKKIEAVLKKHKIPTTSPIGGKSAQLVADFFDSFHGESVDEAYARPNEKPIGAFTLAGATKFSNSAQGRFEYRISEDSWGKSHGLPHEVCVSSKDPTGKQNWRAANVKGTVCIIALDEDAEGKPVLEKWAIRNHVKYVKAEETDQEGEVIKEQDRAAVQGSKSSFKEAI